MVHKSLNVTMKDDFPMQLTFDHDYPGQYYRYHITRYRAKHTFGQLPRCSVRRLAGIRLWHVHAVPSAASMSTSGFLVIRLHALMSGQRKKSETEVAIYLLSLAPTARSHTSDSSFDAPSRARVLARSADHHDAIHLEMSSHYILGCPHRAASVTRPFIENVHC